MDLDKMHELSFKRNKLKNELDRINEEINKMIETHMNYIRPNESISNNRLLSLYESKNNLEGLLKEIDEEFARLVTSKIPRK